VFLKKHFRTNKTIKIGVKQQSAVIRLPTMPILSSVFLFKIS